MDENDLVNQVCENSSDILSKDVMARKIYRQRVAQVAEWDSINKERLSIMPINLIPQKSAKLDQVLNNRINDPWNEPTIIMVHIVNAEHKPTEMKFTLDSFAQTTTSETIFNLKLTNQHPENTFNWQFGIDKLQVDQFIQAWMNLNR